MPQNLTNEKSTLVNVMACLQGKYIALANVDPDLCRYMASLGHCMSNINSNIFQHIAYWRVKYGRYFTDEPSDGRASLLHCKYLIFLIRFQQAISQHWFRFWAANTRRFLNECWFLMHWRIYAPLGPIYSRYAMQIHILSTATKVNCLAVDICYKIHMGPILLHPFPNFNGATIQVREMISHFIPHFTGHVTTYPWRDYI